MPGGPGINYKLDNCMRDRYFFLIGILLALLSCNKQWDKDYYSYRIGARINGKEYHEMNTFLGSYYYGLKYDCWNGYTIIKSEDMHVLPLPKSNDLYTISFTIIVDTSFFNSLVFPATFYFDGKTDCGDDRVIRPDLFEEQLETPWVYGDFSKTPWNVNKPFYANEGYITIRGFDSERHNSGKVSFEFEGVSNDGETIIVEDGYIYNYSKL